MTYHNFANRLSIRRPAEGTNVPHPAVSQTKKPRPAKKRRLAAAAVLLLLASLGPDARATTESPLMPLPAPPASGVNTPTLIVTITGVLVGLLRVPALWRRDFHG
jgi:hypothetical protein